jgi:hypothetical protein
LNASRWGHANRQFAHVALQGDCQPTQNCKSNIPFPALYSTEIGAIDLRHQGKCLLREAYRLSLSPNAIAQIAEGFCLVHRQG